MGVYVLWCFTGGGGYFGGAPIVWVRVKQHTHEPSTPWKPRCPLCRAILEGRLDILHTHTHHRVFEVDEDEKLLSPGDLSGHQPGRLTRGMDL
jgi:hypothetical protein